jgi:hypothetical protein
MVKGEISHLDREFSIKKPAFSISEIEISILAVKSTMKIASIVPLKF